MNTYTLCANPNCPTGSYAVEGKRCHSCRTWFNRYGKERTKAAVRKNLAQQQKRMMQKPTKVQEPEVENTHRRKRSSFEVSGKYMTREQLERLAAIAPGTYAYMMRRRKQYTPTHLKMLKESGCA